MIAVVGLSKRYRQGSAVVDAVKKLTFQVREGEVYGLLGPNGAGKTTSMRMILGLLPADEGYAEVLGYRSDRDPENLRAQIGLVSAHAGVYPWLSVRETLRYFASLYGVPDRTANDRLERLARDLDLREFLDRRANVLSTGQKQRLHLARALIHDPPVMLLDEPTHGLDVIGSEVVFRYIERLRGEGRSILLTTHHLDDAQRICDRFGLMHRGELRLEGTFDELRARSGRDSLHGMFRELLASDPSRKSGASLDYVIAEENGGGA
jgi:ABC-2 type transport system ATP-binding protein/sodium transport system ATP-binding protein